jgi:glycyl-tRNA synthetase alpha chain
MEVSQFTYFQQVGGFDCNPVAGELTYGLERLAMYCQGIDRIPDLNFNGREDDKKVLYGGIFVQAEQEYSRYNFEFADTRTLHRHFEDAANECKELLAKGEPSSDTCQHKQILPAYDQAIKASHIFNLLDARGVISVTERQSYIMRVRDLTKACCAAWLKTEGGGFVPQS